MIAPPDWILPDWPAPDRVGAVVTTRVGGVSAAPFDTMNLGFHVGDDTAAVARNRALLLAALDLPVHPQWLNQVHGTRVERAVAGGRELEADAVWSDIPGLACAIMTADCLPVLFCTRDGRRVAAAHAGWRGLLSGVLENTVTALDTDPARVLAWMGPAIGPDAFEVGTEVRDAFLAHGDAEAAFRPHPDHHGKWFADLYLLASARLAALGVGHVGGGGWCTFSEPGRFFSFRRDGRTGRMASLVWIREDAESA